MIFFTKANEVLQFGRKLTAVEAKQWGLVSDIYKPEELTTVLLPKIRKMRESLVNVSIKTNKMLIRKWNTKLLHEVNDAEWKELETRLASPEFFDAVMRFMRKAKNKL